MNLYANIEERTEDQKTAEIYTYIDMIAIEDLKQFVVDCLNKYGDEDKLFYANKVARVVTDMLRYRSLLSDDSHQSFVDCMLASCLLHNLFYNPNDFTTLFAARRDLAPIADQYGIPEEVANVIYQTIEAQLGEETPVPMVRPQVNSPTELFAYATFFVRHYEFS